MIYLTNSVAKLLKGIFYPKFLPKCPVNQFFISGWKIVILNHGPGEVLLKRLSDNHSETLTQNEIQKNFLYEDDYINLVQKNGYILEKRSKHLLYFIPQQSEHSISDLDA